MHEDLLGYLLGALSPDEQRRVEDALAVDPQLRRELERLRRRLGPLDWINQQHDPPEGLAERTLSAIDCQDEACRPTPRSLARQRQSRLDVAAQGRPSAQSRFYSISDGVVLALVGLTAITLLMPALANSRYEARKGTCQNNLRQIGGSLIEDSLRFGGSFISVPVSGNRAFDGVYASKMLDRQLVSANSTAFLCPGAESREGAEPRRTPSLRQIDAATGAELDSLRRMAGGSYAYVVGYRDVRGMYHDIRNDSRPYFPILSDMPSLYLEWRQSANHGGRGQNIFYEDGHICFLRRVQPLVGDDPWRNRQGYAEAGYGHDDAVLLPSEWPPIVTISEGGVFEAGGSAETRSDEAGGAPAESLR